MSFIVTFQNLSQLNTVDHCKREELMASEKEDNREHFLHEVTITANTNNIIHGFPLTRKSDNK